MSKITLTGHIIIPPSALASVNEELPNHIALTRAESGCLRFEVSADSDQPNRFHVHEVFADRAAFDAHQQRVKQSTWGALTRDAERHYRIEEA